MKNGDIVRIFDVPNTLYKRYYVEVDRTDGHLICFNDLQFLQFVYSFHISTHKHMRLLDLVTSLKELTAYCQFNHIHT